MKSGVQKGKIRKNEFRKFSEIFPYFPSSPISQNTQFFIRNPNLRSKIANFLSQKGKIRKTNSEKFPYFPMFFIEYYFSYFSFF